MIWVIQAKFFIENSVDLISLKKSDNAPPKENVYVWYTQHIIPSANPTQ